MAADHRSSADKSETVEDPPADGAPRRSPGADPSRFEPLTASHDLALAVSHTTTFELDTLTGGLSWSPNAAEVLGCSRSDIAPSLRSLLAPMLAGPVAQRRDSEYELEQRITTKRGEDRVYVIRARSWLSDEHATHAGLYGAIVDVTEQRHAAQQLVDLIDRYRLLVELSPDGIVVHEAGVIRYANTAAGNLARTRPVAMVGRSIIDFVEPSELEETLTRILALSKPGMVSEPAIVTLVAADGSRFKIESVSVRTTWEGRPAYQVIMRDVAERELAKQALRAQADLVSSVSDAIIATGPDQNVSSWNPAAERIFGWTTEEVIGQNIIERSLFPEDVARMQAGLLADGQWSGDITVRHKDGTMRPIHASVAAMTDIHGRPGTVSVCSDQSVRHAAAAAKAEAEHQFSTVVSSLDEGIVVFNADGQVRFSNPAAARIFGCDADHLGTHFVDGMSFDPRDDDGEPLEGTSWPVRALLGGGASVLQQVIAVTRPDGERVWLRLSVHPLNYVGVDGSRSFVCSFTDITEQHRHSAELAWTASHDELTGLPNRSAMSHLFGEAIERHPQTTAALFCNLDRFKEVNDRLGYRVGDAVLHEVAERLAHMTRAGDVVGRLNSDEFLILCQNATVDDARRLADRMVFELGRPLDVVLDSRTMSVTLGASVGVAHSSGPALVGGDVAELLQAADVAMHRAKARGRGRVEVFDGTRRDETRRRLDLRDALRIALDAKALEVHYQAIWHTDADPQCCKIAGFEALVRWTHPTLGRQNPEEFVAVAEDTGLISQLGMYVLERACRQTVEWRRQGHDVYVSVNLSARQLSNGNLVPTVATTLFRTGLPPKALWLELTETALAEEGLDAVSVLEGLVELGVRISIDDFGTGYSSLGRLRHYPVSALKVDRSFVADMTATSAPDGIGDGGAIVESTIALANRLGLVVIAEGVETTDQLAALAELNCQLSQGFLLARPVPASEVSFTPVL